MSGQEHLSEDLLVRYFDGECTASEHSTVETHTGACEKCRARLQAISQLSASLEALSGFGPNPNTAAFGHELQQLIAQREAAPAIRSRRWLGWTAGIAAVFAGVLVIASHLHTAASAVGPVSGATFQVAGETFTAVPYSNPDLPVDSLHIVQMQMPVASLIDAGILLDPVSEEPDALDRSVLADVLMGADGEPVAVHVVGD